DPHRPLAEGEEATELIAKLGQRAVLTVGHGADGHDPNYIVSRYECQRPSTAPGGRLPSTPRRARSTGGPSRRTSIGRSGPGATTWRMACEGPPVIGGGSLGAGMTAAVAAVAPAGPARAGGASPARLVLPPAPRVIVFAPHPDDETIATGGLI